MSWADSISALSRCQSGGRGQVAGKAAVPGEAAAEVAVLLEEAAKSGGRERQPGFTPRGLLAWLGEQLFVAGRFGSGGNHFHQIHVGWKQSEPGSVARRPGRGVGFGVLDGDGELEGAAIEAMITLLDAQFSAMGIAGVVQPGSVGHADGFRDKGV